MTELEKLKAEMDTKRDAAFAAALDARDACDAAFAVYDATRAALAAQEKEQDNG